MKHVLSRTTSDCMRPAALTTGASAQVLQDALALHQAGRLAEAQRLYQEILRADPERFDALQLLFGQWRGHGGIDGLQFGGQGTDIAGESTLRFELCNITGGERSRDQAPPQGA